MQCAPHIRGILQMLALALVIFHAPMSQAGSDQPDDPGAAPGGRLDQPRGADGCVHRTAINRCARGRALTSPEDLVVSPDGRHVYVASYGSDALGVFARDRRTGVLRQLSGPSGCFSARPGGGCTLGRALNEPTSVAASPDGARVYVAGRRFPSGVAVFARAPDGSLSQPEGTGGCVSHRGGLGCSAARGMSAPQGGLVTPDSPPLLLGGAPRES